MSVMKREKPVNQISGFCIGQTENEQAGTGCTVIIGRNGMCAGLDIRGGGPASRDAGILHPLASAGTINAVVLAGGSAFGLDAAGGVMEYLEQRGIGFDVGVTRVPLVVQSDIFDLTVADPSVRPDRKMGYEAARIAMEAPNYRDGNYGAGCGATVGKLGGMNTCMKSGIGSYAVELDGLQIGAVVAVNALGDIFDWKSGKKIAGMLTEDGKGFIDSTLFMQRNIKVHENRFVDNTTIGAVLTNASFNKSELCKIASMTHNGYARSIRPVHTSADGDSIYALSSAEIEADIDLVGTLAADVMAEAVARAVRSAVSAYGFTAASDLDFEL